MPAFLRAPAKACLATLLFAAAAAVQAQPWSEALAVRGAEGNHPCGPVYYSATAWGPRDYRTASPEERATVEAFHFTPIIEAGIRGLNSTVAGELNFTLKALPNNHRALVTLTKIVMRAKSDRLLGFEWPGECYFNRAIRFRPDDTVVRMLYAQYLGQLKRREEALRQLQAAVSNAGGNGLTHYNAGLVALEVGEPKFAVEQARMALELGFPRRELVDKLAKAGHWSEPPPPQAAAAPAADAASAPTAPTAPTAPRAASAPG
jgi:tetratricopeptide (TPR) repeat protein